MEKLGNDPGLSTVNIRDELEMIINKGLMTKVDNSEFKFLHNKIQEAAYGLIPETEKSYVSTTVNSSRLVTNFSLCDYVSFFTSAPLQTWDVIVSDDYGRRC